MDTLNHKLDPLPYHLAVRDYLKAQERDLRYWFASERARADYTDNKELKLKVRDLRKLKEQVADMLANAEGAA